MQALNGFFRNVVYHVSVEEITWTKVSGMKFWWKETMSCLVRCRNYNSFPQSMKVFVMRNKAFFVSLFIIKKWSFYRFQNDKKLYRYRYRLRFWNVIVIVIVIALDFEPLSLSLSLSLKNSEASIIVIVIALVNLM